MKQMKVSYLSQHSQMSVYKCYELSVTGKSK